MEQTFLTLNEASNWASEYLKRKVTAFNISYLIQYAKIKRYIDGNRAIKIKTIELKNYYDENILKQKYIWKQKLGDDLNWSLSFDNLREADTTKHVHRLHPYKGKFIPQLVEYFLDSKLNTYKKEIFFNKGDIVLDPFMGSGTTLIQSSELGLHSIGVDVSGFNCLMSKVKSDNYDFEKLDIELNKARKNTIEFSNKTFDDNFDKELRERLSVFNKTYFTDDFKFKVRRREVDEQAFGKEKLIQFLEENKELFEKNGTKDKSLLVNEEKMSSFLSKWFSKRIKQELSHYLKLIEDIEDEKIQNVMRIILSRTARSCRATTHYDLATLKEPQLGPYYCRKHKKICTPVNTIINHLQKNTFDTLNRLREYARLKHPVFLEVIHGDSREVDILKEIEQKNKQLHEILKNKKIAGVFTSPPYVGQIDYHEQHAYAYELFNIKREDEKEIGPLYKGRGQSAKQDYIEGVSNVLKNINPFIKKDGNFFIVANDKFNLYPLIAKKSDLEIVNRHKRPVLNRTESDKQPYAEIIFHMKKI